MGTAIKPLRTLLEVFQSLREGTLAQLIQNELIISPSPFDVHQQVLISLAAVLHFHVKQHKLGELRVAPYDVYFDKDNVYQPDIIFISNIQTEKIKPNGFHGAPEMVIEILSPSTARYDLEEKKKVYEQYGVKEYTVIDPAIKSVTVYTLQKKGYSISFAGTQIVQFALLNNSFEF
jgi:Uma2 family endonuclease